MDWSVFGYSDVSSCVFVAVSATDSSSPHALSESDLTFHSLLLTVAFLN